MKISIITVCFNSDKYLRDTILSVLSQDYDDIEYILVDGASKDDTLDIIKEYEPLFNGRMKWISESDKGLYDAMNKGIKLASGDVVGTLNSDDFFTSSDVISRIAAAFNMDEELELLYGDIHFVNPGDLNKSVRYYSSSVFKPSLLRLGFMPAHPSMYIRRECFDKYGYYALDYKIAADFDLVARYVYTHRVKNKYLKMDFVTMRTGGESANRLLLNKETVLACRRNGITTNIFLLSLKYFYKVFEYIQSRRTV